MYQPFKLSNHLLPNSCLSACGVLSFCDERAWTIIVLVTHTCRTFFMAMFSQSCEELINILLFDESVHTK